MLDDPKCLVNKYSSVCSMCLPGYGIKDYRPFCEKVLNKVPHCEFYQNTKQCIACEIGYTLIISLNNDSENYCQSNLEKEVPLKLQIENC